ncbi:hypothetical protein Hanom_Chr03g00229761 [Helianthus anomalus]
MFVHESNLSYYNLNLLPFSNISNVLNSLSFFFVSSISSFGTEKIKNNPFPLSNRFNLHVSHCCSQLKISYHRISVAPKTIVKEILYKGQQR